MSEDRYIRYQDEKQRDYENLCKRCGACCGVFDKDPCINLKEGKEGRYFCEVYENRFGMQRSISGREFTCVPIRNILHKSWFGDFNCAYKRRFQEGYTRKRLTNFCFYGIHNEKLVPSLKGEIPDLKIPVGSAKASPKGITLGLQNHI